MKNFKTKGLIILAATLLTVGLVACNGTTDPQDTEAPTDGATNAPEVTVEVTDPVTDIPTEEPTEEPTEAPTEEPTEAPTEPPIKEQLGLDINKSDLHELMQPIFGGTSSVNETVMFLDKGDVKTLLYPIETIVSVTSYDGKKVYEEGKDYVIEDGKLKVTENSSIPCITRAKYYNSSETMLQTEYDGKKVWTHWGEGQVMTNWQVNVNYTHTAEWEGYAQAAELEIYQNFVKKLQAGEDVTVFFYGDSITYGANASWLNGYAPFQDSYPILFVKALADLFDYTVHFEASNLTAPNNGMATSKVPTEDYVAGDRGTITYVNTAIGGWTSTDGVTYYDTFIKDKINAHGCDLFIIGFGMNDGGAQPRQTSQNIEKVVDGVLELKPEANIVLLSTMVPNPNATNGWYGNQDKQEAQLIKLAEEYRADGKACGVACMTSVSLAILEEKEFHDYSGNNINHPNDYFVRVYAQTLLQTVIGYENMN